MKCSSIRIIGIPEEKDKKKDHEKILEEIIVENFPKMGKKIVTQVQEPQRVPNRINPRQNTPRHILIKLTKIKNKEFLLKDKLLSLWESPCVLFVAFPLLLLICVLFVWSLLI